MYRNGNQEKRQERNQAGNKEKSQNVCFNKDMVLSNLK